MIMRASPIVIHLIMYRVMKHACVESPTSQRGTSHLPSKAKRSSTTLDRECKNWTFLLFFTSYLPANTEFLTYRILGGVDYAAARERWLVVLQLVPNQIGR